MKKAVFGVNCIFAVVGLGFVDGVDRYFIYRAVTCHQVEVVVLEYYNLAGLLYDLQIEIILCLTGCLQVLETFEYFLNYVMQIRLGNM